MLPHRWQPTRLLRPWDSPGKNTGVGCHCLLLWQMRPRKLAWDHTATKTGAGFWTWTVLGLLGSLFLTVLCTMAITEVVRENQTLFSHGVPGPCLAVETTFFLWKLPIVCVLVCVCMCIKLFIHIHKYSAWWIYTNWTIPWDQHREQNMLGNAGKPKLLSLLLGVKLQLLESNIMKNLSL